MSNKKSNNKLEFEYCVKLTGEELEIQMRSAHGSSLSMDWNLCWLEKPKSIFVVYILCAIAEFATHLFIYVGRDYLRNYSKLKMSFL